MRSFLPKHWYQQILRIASPYRQFWWSNQLVDNQGSVARDILAAERTFLAWARTGLGFVGAGSALFAAYHEDPMVLEQIVPACGLLVTNGSYLLVFATRRYLSIIQAMQTHNKFPINAGGTLTAVFVTAAGTISSLIIVARADVGFDKRAKRWISSNSTVP